MESSGMQTLQAALMEHALVVTTDMAGTIIHASDKFLELSAYPEAALLGQSLQILGLVGSSDEPVALPQAIASGESWQGMVHAHRIDGSRYSLQLTALHLPGRSASDSRCVLFGTDVSARERQPVAYEALVNPAQESNLFLGIARVVADGLDCMAAGIGRLVRDNTGVQTVGFWFDGKPYDDFFYELGGTPCESCLLQGQPMLFVETDVANQYPSDLMLSQVGAVSYRGASLWNHQGEQIGILFAIDNKPCRNDANDRAFLKVAAARAAAELQRMATEEDLRNSEERLRLALETAELALWDHDLESGTSTCNARWAQMRGYQVNTASCHENWQADMHADDRSAVQAEVDAVFSGERGTYDIEYRVHTGSGYWRWIHERTRVVKRGGDGQPLRIVGIQQDIHERRMADEKLRENERRLLLTVEAAELGTWEWRAPGMVTCSDHTAAMLGYEEDEIPRDTAGWYAISHPDDLPGWFRQIEAHFAGETEHLDAVVRRRAKDGHWVWVRINGRLVERDETGRVIRCLGTHQDVSQLKNAEIALREGEAHLRAVIENSPIGIFLCGASGEIVFRNETIRRLHGDAGDREYGFGWEDYIHPEDRERVVKRWLSYVAKPQGLFEIEWRHAHKAAGDRLLQIRAVPVREQERLLGFAGTIEDITERRSAEVRERNLQLQLQQAQKMEAIGQLTSGIAHDFNNSLATILGFASLSLGRLAEGSNPKVTQYLETIIEAGEHARDLVDKLLAFTRNRPATRPVPTDLEPLLHKAVAMLGSVIPSTIQIETRVDGHVPPVLLDPTDLQQIVFNLVLNARDAMNGHGHLAIRLAPVSFDSGTCSGCHNSFAADFVELSVTDSGNGISPDHLGRIFDPFFSTKPVGKGTGMGLSVLHGIVHAAGGHVVVKTTHGVGTLFRILLPPSTAAATARPTLSTTGDLTGLSTGYCRVLVVDDDASVAGFVCELLEDHGFETRQFGDSLAALEWALGEDAEFSILVTDQTMPGLTGIELIRKLREQRPTLPAMLCTGLRDAFDESTLDAAGVKRVFGKPVNIPEFMAAMVKACKELQKSVASAC